MKLIRFYLFSALLLALFALPYSALAKKPQVVETFVYNLSADVLRVLNNTQMDEAQKEAALEIVFEEAVDIDWMGRFAVGSSWRSASEADKRLFLTHYKAFLKQSYVPKFRTYTNQKLNITKISHIDDADAYLIETEIVIGDTQTIKVDYKVRQYQESYRIFDVIAEGISLITTQRADFRGILSRKGLSVLTERLKARTAS